MQSADKSAAEAQTLVASLRAFCFPGGEASARLIRGVRTTQRGQFRMAPGASWTPFTAGEFIDSRQSAFRWQARIGTGIRALGVTDAYEQGRGYLQLKAAGVIPVKKFTGPDFDRGELQRYLASIVFCPAMALNHPTLEFTAAEPLILRMRDRADASGATVDLELSPEGRPLAVRALRPRMAGKQIILTPWSAAGLDYQDWEGLRVACRMQVFWHLDDGPFCYFDGEVNSFEAVKEL